MSTELNLKKDQKTVIYLDANNMFFRAYHSAEANGGNPLHFFLNMTYSLVSSHQHDFAFAVFDGENSKYERLKLSPIYKENRKDKDQEEKEKIHLGMQTSKEILNALGFNVYDSEGIESDDVIGILAKRSADKGFNVIIVSSDKDYKQMCQYSPYINILNTQNQTVTNQNNFTELNGIPLDTYVDYLALVGDKSDNIIGVEKVGEVTAKKWINAVGGGISKIKENLDQIKNGKVKDNLLEAIENGRLDVNYKLVSFMFDKEDYIKIDKAQIKKSKINIEALDTFCIEKNMKQFREKYIDPLIPMGQYARKKELQDKLQNKTTQNERKRVTVAPF